ncbi:MAG: histidinol-phosphatase [Anaerolineae bacterium]|nr:histidinol-phosphatase [Anaerolineae bacterium]
MIRPLIPVPAPQDYHIHSTASPDGSSTMEAVCLRAIELGVEEIGFTDHATFDPHDPHAGLFDATGYFDEIDYARERYGQQVIIRAGLEMDYSPDCDKVIRTLLEAHPFDFVLGSVHIVEDEHGWANFAHEPGVSGWFASRDERAAYLPYFRRLEEAVHSGLFDVIAHFDLAKWHGVEFYGPFQPELFAAETESILATMVERGIGLEVNASGLFQPPAEPYPVLDIVQRYAAAGGTLVTVGSDAHHTAQVGQGIERAVALARLAGIRHLTSFHQRRAQPRPFTSFRLSTPAMDPEPLRWR